jgi:catechol 2,3-dioxygenase-like lactoylglutathione lyase family enzyme
MRFTPKAAPSRTAQLALVALVAAGALAATGPALAQASGGTPSIGTIRPMLWQDGMKRSDIGEVNVFRRFPADRTDAVNAFYNEVLGLAVLPQTALGGGAMIRYPVGLSEVKLFPTKDAEPNTATVGSAIGVRLLTFFYDNQAALSQRFAKHGLEPPTFHSPGSRPGSIAAALAQDPAGEWVELVIVPKGSADLARFEIGVAAADVEKSRSFYRDLLGLQEHGPVRDELLGATRYAYTHGTTTINVFDVEADLPKRAQAAGMQYIVWSASSVNDVAQARGATIDRPLSAPGQMRTIWLFDPDGVSNYFAEFAGNDNTPPR